MHKVIFISIILLLISGKIWSQTHTELTGHWVNVTDSTEQLTLNNVGKFRLVHHDTFSGEHNKYQGKWLYKSRKKKRKLFLIYENDLPKQFFIVRKRGELGYTLNDMKQKVVYARRVLSKGEVLPKIETAIR